MKNVFIIVFLSLSLAVKAQIKINDKLECSWLEYDFKTIEIGKTASCVIPVKNIDISEIYIDYLITSCKCITAYTNTKKIKPNGSCSINISYDTSNKSPGEIYQYVILYLSDKSTYIFGIKAKLEVAHHK